MDVLGQQRVGQPAEQRGGEPHVRHRVAGTREDADDDRPSQWDANDGDEYDDGHAERATLEEHAAHVIAQRLVDVGEHGERRLEEAIGDGPEQAAFDGSGIR